MTLADNQVSFAPGSGTVILGAGTAYRILHLKGVRDMPPIQTNDTPMLTVDGVFSGYDTLLARVIEAQIMVTGTSGSNFETNLSALETAMTPILNGTAFLNWKLPNLAEKKIAARPRSLGDQILPTYKKLWTVVDLAWAAPTPAILTGP